MKKIIYPMHPDYVDKIADDRELETEEVEECEDESVYIADCGHECYKGEHVYTFDSLKLCPDCMQAELNQLSLFEIACFLGIESQVI